MSTARERAANAAAAQRAPFGPDSIVGEEVLPTLSTRTLKENAKMARKAQPKAAAPLPAARTSTAPLDRLYVAPENARAGVEPENIDELAANIIACDLLEPLVVYEDHEGNFAVCAGRRRRAALLTIREAAKLSPGAPAFAKFNFDAIAVNIIPQENASAASLAENTHRVDLGIVEAAIAWNRMATIEKRDVSEIAKAFGVTERFVQSRIKLASLHEPILEALRAGEISLDVAQIYATAHMSRQEKVWKQLGKQRGNQWSVKEELKKNTLRAGDGIAKFVGEEAYVAAGGQIEQELFQSPDMSRWLDPALAEQLAQDKLKAKAAELEAEGFLFVESAVEMPNGKYVDGNLGKPRKPSADEKAALKKLADEEKALRKEAADIDKAVDKRDEQGGDSQYTEEEDARQIAIDERLIDIREEREQIESQLFDYDDKAKAKSGIAITINDDGRFVIDRGIVAPKERRSTPAGKATSKGKAASTKPAKPEPQAPMTNGTHEKTGRIASVIVGRALMGNTPIAIVAITAAAARDVFYSAAGGNYGNAVHAQNFDTALSIDDLLSEPAYDAARQRWQVALGTKENGLEAKLATWPQADVLDLLAFCVGHSVKIIEPQAAADYSKQDSRQQIITLGKLAGANPAAHFIPDAEYLEGYSKASLESAAAELGLDVLKGASKAALAALIADNAKGGGATAAWVPPLLRTLCGVDETVKPKPAAKASAAKKTAKKAAAKKPAKKIAKQPVKTPAAKGARK